MEEISGFRKFLITLLFILFAAIAFGLIWFFFWSPASPVGAGWYLFSFAAGLSMIVLPCTLPLAFVIVPLSMGKGAAKGFAIATAFGVGVALTLSLYGVFAAVLGKVAIGSLGAPLEVVKNWLYFVAGAFAFLFALGELGLIRLRMPSYSGAFPGFIQKQQDVLKALLLGLFLGNVGVGCPHPATPVILTRIAVSGDVFYGWLLFFVHAVGRVLPLIFLAILAILGVNLLAGLVKNKDRIQRATGWGMVLVAGFILVLGLFSHDWWVASGQHTFLEELTGEEKFLGIVSNRLNLAAPHAHAPPPATATGLFGLPVNWGTWVLLFLWITPLFWYYLRKRKSTKVMIDSPEKEIAKKTLPYHFWTIVSVSLVLVLTFGYILPNRFREQTEMHGMEEMMDERMEDGRMSAGGMMSDISHAGAHESFYHEEGEVTEGVVVSLLVAPEKPESEAKTKLEFVVKIRPSGESVKETDLELQHEKKMHVIGVRDDLTNFFHIHPEVKVKDSGLFTVEHIFKEPGSFKIWSEIKYAGENHAFGHPIVQVAGEGPTSKLEKEIVKNRIVDNYQITLDYAEIGLGDNHIDFKITDSLGRPAKLENYLGEKMHLAMISEDLREFIHTHPDVAGHDSGAPAGDGHTDHSHSLNTESLNQNANTLEALTDAGHTEEAATTAEVEPDHIGFTLPIKKASFYKVFAQFRPEGTTLEADTSLVAEFWIEAKEFKVVAEKSGKGAAWWRNLIISIILIFALSWAVKKYITVPPVVTKK